MRMWLVLGLGIGLGLATLAQARHGSVPMGEIGDPQAGFEYAHAVCAACHAISQEKITQSEGTKVQGRRKYTGNDANRAQGLATEREPSHDAKYYD